ncbi:SMC-Scp complex subunit ScpB [Latilactobacillus sakei subsp. carnosus]|uniref:SMC-Scp complex subunit ScpB n=1 Tax=Latilactobacillus TaxID=2767885 RepID=UPI000C127ECB|nr:MULTISPECIES: SMC-Scp complex subunit ScpB [Latilactobacillus]MCM1570674.1 SMC-Scp complex subunit ScpB [Latilactobacillus sakei]MDV8937124.1 SMC-Scp complex subunit ScpB [Latilactobacillus sp.]MDV8938811.1 SMC-Scp complex subunit ScpB [Latilactobacillus sp.]MDV8940645.1 SMC-Scp complex subunit ScpB [Latilactobacillus sp.]MDV8942429.1 SMC-Scp complex subunit ScpB [Latilactobacillus sp.]
MNHLAEIESLLYVAGDEGITLQHIARLIMLDEAAVRQLLTKLAKRYQEDEQSGLNLIQAADCYKLVTKKAYAGLLKAYFDGPVSTSISQAALEVLAIIVYRQPLTRIEIDEVRGVQSSGAIQTLLARQLIVEKGRKDAPGRPILYGTSDYFLDYFGLGSLKELPELEQMTLTDDTAESDNDSADLYYRQFEQTLNETGLETAPKGEQ